MDALKSEPFTAIVTRFQLPTILVYVQVIFPHIRSAALNGLNPSSLNMDALKWGSITVIYPFSTPKKISYSTFNLLSLCRVCGAKKINSASPYYGRS